MKGRYKDINWDLSNSEGKIATWQHVQIAVLMDIRDELKQLNSLLHCQSFVEIPSILRKVVKNTTKKKRPKVKPQLRVVSR